MEVLVVKKKVFANGFLSLGLLAGIILSTTTAEAHNIGIPHHRPVPDDAPQTTQIKLKEKGGKNEKDLSAQHYMICSGTSEVFYTNDSKDRIGGQGATSCPEPVESIAVYTDLLKNGDIMASNYDTQSGVRNAYAYAGTITHERFQDYKEESTHYIVHDGVGTTSYSADDTVN